MGIASEVDEPGLTKATRRLWPGIDAKTTAAKWEHAGPAVLTVGARYDDNGAFVAEIGLQVANQAGGS